MNKLIIIFVAIVANMMTGCVDARAIGRKAAEGALNAAQDFGERFSEKRNAAELAAAVSKGEQFGITYDQIDTDGDGVFSGSEATSFAFRVGQIELGSKAKPALDKLLRGDFKGAEKEAKDAGGDVWAMIQGYLLMIMTAGGTGAVVLRKHKRMTADLVHAERDNNRLKRGEKV